MGGVWCWALKSALQPRGYRVSQAFPGQEGFSGPADPFYDHNAEQPGNSHSGWSRSEAPPWQAPQIPRAQGASLDVFYFTEHFAAVSGFQPEKVEGKGCWRTTGPCFLAAAFLGCSQGSTQRQNHCQERPHSPAGLLFGFCSKPALLPLGISPKKINLETLHHGASPAPEASSSPRAFPSRVLRKRLLEALSHVKIKEPSPASRIFTPLPCQNRPVIQQQFRILPREEKIKPWLFLFGKQAREKKKKNTAASSFDLKRKKITYTEHRMCKNRAPD